MSRPYIPQTLTPVEAQVEGQIKRDPLRKMAKAHLEGELEQLEIGYRMFDGEKWRAHRDKIGRRIAEIKEELLRRRRVV